MRGNHGNVQLVVREKVVCPHRRQSAPRLLVLRRRLQSLPGMKRSRAEMRVRGRVCAAKGLPHP